MQHSNTILFHIPHSGQVRNKVQLYLKCSLARPRVYDCVLLDPFSILAVSKKLLEVGGNTNLLTVLQ